MGEGVAMPAKKNHPDAPYVEEVVERLSAFAPVSSRFMFGGFGLYCEGAMFGLVEDGTLYLRADDENRAEFEAVGSRPWVPDMKGKPMPMPYYPVPDHDMDDNDSLHRWFESARAAASRVAASKGGRTRAR